MTVTSTDGDALVAAALGARLATEVQRAWCHQCHDLTAHRRDVLNRSGVRVASFIACPNCEIGEQPVSELRYDMVTRDEASRALARMAEAGKGAAEASAVLHRAVTDLTEEEDRDAGYGVVELVLIVVVVVLAMVGIYYLAAH